MAEREDEILMERIEQPKGEIVVVVFPMDRVERHIVQSIVHPPHVPFEAETEPADIDWTCHHRPSRGFLGYRGGAAGFPENPLVHPPQKNDPMEIRPSAKAVGDPFPGIAAVVEI